MSKEPVRREDLPKSEQGQPRDFIEQDQPEKGWHHGYTPEQIKLMEDAREAPVEGTPLAATGEKLADPGEKLADPDELEEELDEAEEEGDFKSTHRGRPGKTGRGK